MTWLREWWRARRDHRRAFPVAALDEHREALRTARRRAREIEDRIRMLEFQRGVITRGHSTD